MGIELKLTEQQVGALLKPSSYTMSTQIFFTNNHHYIITLDCSRHQV